MSKFEFFEALVALKPTAANIEEWQGALAPSLKTAHPNRIDDWVRGRMALRNAFANAQVHLEIPAFRYMSLKTLPPAPGWTFSISHCSDAALAIVARDSHSVGVDLEKADRSVNAEVDARVRRPEDIALSPLHLWSAKEAIFKALPIERQTGVTVSLISVSRDTFAISSIGASGEWRQVVEGPYVKSYAWMNPK